MRLAAIDPFVCESHPGSSSPPVTVLSPSPPLRESEQTQKDGKRSSTDRKTKSLKTALEELHQEVKNVELFFQHIHWLHERFPKAAYEDVTGLCKLADLAEIKEQDYSLNPGRYVGVVIEEDGKTEEEFVEEVLTIEMELAALNKTADSLGAVISSNLSSLVA